jgi:hypothetical protein
MKRPLIISLDIETYGAFESNHYGLLLPEQTVFHPERSLHTDKVARHDLIQTVAITLVEGDPSDPSTFTPSKTFVLHMHDRSHQLLLFKWLRSCTHILGMNLLFDLSYIFTAFPEARYSLSHRPTIIDLSILIYLNSELQTERSLKDIGPYLGTHSYSNEPSLRDGKRFPSPFSEEAIRYNALDTHNTVLAIAALASIIPSAYGPTDKLSPFCLTFYSKTIWSLLRLTLSGIHFNRPRLLRLHNWLTRFTSTSASLASSDHNLILEGKGSTLSKTSFLETALDEADSYQNPSLGTQPCPPTNPALTQTHETTPTSSPTEIEDSAGMSAPAAVTPPTAGKPNQIPTTSVTTASSLRNHPLLILTEKTRKLSFCNENRQLISNLLPPLSRMREGLTLAFRHARSQKLLSSYTYPLLFHRRTDEQDQRSVILPTSLTHPIFYPVPSSFDTAESQFGGTIQGRVTCKLPSAQTFPKLIQRCYSSRFGPRGLLLSMDLAQIELRVAALLSGDPSLMSAFLDPSIDLHTDRAIELLTEQTLISKYGPNFRKVKAFRTIERQAGKTVNFSDLFLSSPHTIQSTINNMLGLLIPIEVCQAIVNRRPTSRPGLWAWQQSLLRSAERDGFIVLPFIGQSRYFAGGSAHLNEIVNFPIQTTAGNVLLAIQHELDDLLPRWESPHPPVHMYLNVYDALYFDTLSTYEPQLREHIAEAVRRVCLPTGYWGKLCIHVGRNLPLLYEIS